MRNEKFNFGDDRDPDKLMQMKQVLKKQRDLDPK
jgi:hypothetical protein